MRANARLLPDQWLSVSVYSAAADFAKRIGISRAGTVYYKAKGCGRSEAAKTLCGKDNARFWAAAEKQGVLAAAQSLVRRGQLSDAFGPLADCGHLELSIEATIAKSCFGSLFTDEEVNRCFELLCEYGYYR